MGGKGRNCAEEGEGKGKEWEKRCIVRINWRRDMKSQQRKNGKEDFNLSER